MLYEEVIASAVDPKDLSVGDPVVVVTKMGTPITRGMVVAVFSYGAVQIREYDLEHNGGVQSIADRVYDAELYSFVIDEEGEPETAFDVDAEEGAIENPLAVALPVLQSVDGVVDGIVGKSGAYNIGFSELAHIGEAKADDEEVDDEADAVEEPKKPQYQKKGDIRSDDRTAASKVNMDSLPKDLQKRLKGVSELDEDSVDKVLSAISEAAMRAFKSVGVKDIEIYSKIVDIQKAIRPIVGKKNGSSE
jgi:hypothetical protein